MAKNETKKKKKPSRKQAVRVWPKIILLAIFAVASFGILAVNVLPSQISSAEGDVADADVFYEANTMTYASQLRTAAARSEAASQVEQVFTIDESVTTDLLRQISADFTAMDALRNNTVLDEASRLTALANALPGTYDEELLQYMLDITFSEALSLRQHLYDAINRVYERGVAEDDIITARGQITTLLDATSATELGKGFMHNYIENLGLAGNEFYDALATAAAVEEAMQAVGMVQVTVQSGEKLLSKGSVITAEQIEALQALGMYSDAPRYTAYGGLAGIVLTMFIMLGYYLYFYQYKLFGSDKSVLLLCVTMLLVLLLCKLIAFISFSADNEVSAQIGYLLPVAAASMLLAVLLERNLAILATAVLSIFVAIICDGNASFALVALGGGVTGILTTVRLNQRSQFVGASLYIGLANMVLIGAWGLLYNHSYPLIGIGMVFGLLNGLLSAILAMGILPFLESAFGVTTVVRLLELSNSNHPLMKRLMVEAPGTYNHSILVGNLAEAAADAIGADTLLVRVASSYHDVGKLKRPYFFIENQGLNDNPHDKLQPALSFMIITSHVREGVEMLREHRFPEEIIALVEQHHGTGLLRPFYQKALDMALDKDTVREEDFRYPYTNPQSKEAALVLLADSTQAAVQSLKQATKGEIENMVHSIIQGRMADGQLSECPLTFQDMQQIEEAFLRVLSGMNHSRLLYPEQLSKEVGGSLPVGMGANNFGGNIDAALPEHKTAGDQEGAADTAFAVAESGGTADHSNG